MQSSSVPPPRTRRSPPRSSCSPALLLVVAIVGGMFFMSWVTAPSYAVLSSGLSATDAASMYGQAQLATACRTSWVPAAPRISVPSNKLDAERIALAAAGLPKGNTGGWDILDKEGLTVSSFRQQVDYQRALEGEIASTLQSMDGITQAQVHLVLPDDQLFSDQQSSARASVMLTTSSEMTSEPGEGRRVARLLRGEEPRPEQRHRDRRQRPPAVRRRAAAAATRWRSRRSTRTR